MPRSQRPKIDTQTKGETSSQTGTKDKGKKKKTPAKKKAGEKFYSQGDLMSFLTRK